MSHQTHVFIGVPEVDGHVVRDISIRGHRDLCRSEGSPGFVDPSTNRNAPILGGGVVRFGGVKTDG